MRRLMTIRWSCRRRRWRTRWPCVMAGPTTPTATSTTRKACRRRRFGRISGRSSRSRVGSAHPAGAAAEMLFNWFKSRCPVDPTTRQWIDQRWKWLTNEFGSDLMVGSPTILPTNEFFPDRYDERDDDSVRMLLNRVCEYMQVPVDLVDWKIFSDEGRPQTVNRDGHEIGGAAGLYQEGERFAISIERDQRADAMHLVGTAVHELAHARLLGENRISADAFDNELLTDLTVVFHGLGIFLANVPRHWQSDTAVWPGTDLYKPEYMTGAMYGY